MGVHYQKGLGADVGSMSSTHLGWQGGRDYVVGMSKRQHEWWRAQWSCGGHDPNIEPRSEPHRLFGRTAMYVCGYVSNWER